MRNEGYEGITEVDVRDLDQPINGLDSRYDVVLLADIVEHVEDPGRVIAAALTRVKKDGDVIVSLPNAFYWYSFLNVLLLRREVTHPDHVA
jgi:O-antigen biosynthesis protein